MKGYTDQLQRTLFLQETPRRIVSLVPSQTELLCDLGLESALVGVTKFCVHPSHIRKLVKVVGGTKQIHIEKIKGLKPDIIVCNKEENTKDIVAACQAICPVHVSDIYNIQGSLQLISQYGVIFKVQDKAESMIAKLKQELEDFQLFIKDKPQYRVAYFIWKAPWMVAANTTFIQYLLELNNFENIYKHLNRYPEIKVEEVNKEEQVDFVLLSSEPYPFNKTHEAEFGRYYPNSTIVLVDGEMFSWYGSRLTKAFQYFKKLRLSIQINQA
ncbi:ABC transporter substrate-binding protein [Tamlana fucoidanivorans]|uniref:Cobalamin-binding protein n=1 Tax=Allotamlana fucoidanivorans TaxID=2583814 RepID=A0A5C4SGY0_9FLAO|nr:helical backbone metal receptor [Tamlana fucoidanivorans]TNJ42851.1 cobalamin-binding protein [Tamlana fucoidanivorans]